MRADKDFKTYEQALSAIQSFADQAHDDHVNGRHKDAQYNISRATYVGMKHLLFMAADASIDRADARELAAKNHLATVEVLALALAAFAAEPSDTSPAKAQAKTKAVSTRRRATPSDAKATKKAIGVVRGSNRSGSQG